MTSLSETGLSVCVCERMTVRETERREGGSVGRTQSVMWVPWVPFLPSKSLARAQFLCLSGKQLRDWWKERKWREGRKKPLTELISCSRGLCVCMSVSWPVRGRKCSSLLYSPPTLSSWSSSLPITLTVAWRLGLLAFSYCSLIGCKLKMPLTERLLVCAVFSPANRQRGGISQLSLPVPLSTLTPFSLLIYGT